MQVESVKSATRVIAIFEFFARRRSPANLTQIAAALDCPISSTSMLLRTLLNLGYLHYVPSDRTFVPTVRTALLGIWVNDALMAGGTITRLMYRLRDETGETAVLGVQSGHYVQYINVVKGVERSGYRQVQTGALRPILRSGMGHILLTLKPAHEIRSLVGRINSEEPPSHHVEMKILKANLDECRRLGYAYTESIATPGSGLISILLAAPAHQPPMVLSLGGEVERLRVERERFVAALRDVVATHQAQMETALSNYRTT